ncbi:hypothetical protein IE53DRAFT_95073 [Violaceomyces palustris]|uniref:Uncharacterized protein n=1 Tax=Violaceomyces palustris TaxID=1673888 RepID=A0ACD0NXK5_9BASI|nr:hypothetical protein IE53DRAFT_95073 [Violaceomyces palustris]
MKGSVRKMGESYSPIQSKCSCWSAPREQEMWENGRRGGKWRRGFVGEAKDWRWWGERTGGGRGRKGERDGRCRMQDAGCCCCLLACLLAVGKGSP